MFSIVFILHTEQCDCTIRLTWKGYPWMTLVGLHVELHHKIEEQRFVYEMNWWGWRKPHMAAWPNILKANTPLSHIGFTWIVTKLHGLVIGQHISHSFKCENNWKHRNISLFLRTGLLGWLLGRHFYQKRKNWRFRDSRCQSYPDKREENTQIKDN